VSLNSGAGVLAALLERGHDAVGIDWAPGSAPADAAGAQAGATVVWNALHGTLGEDGAVQGLCACLGPAVHRLRHPGQRAGDGQGDVQARVRVERRADAALDLAAARRSPPTAADADAALAGWKLPLVVKPANEGSSVGVTIVRERAQLAAAVALARRHHGDVIVEDYIAGVELSTSILDGEVLGSVEIRPATEWYDYDVKYKRNDTQYLCPPTLAADVVARAEAHARAAYLALGCTGAARPDLRITPAGDAYVLEVNTLPGMTKTSLLPKAARHAGMDYPTLCERILAGAR
jgi:D-alanine-D-alanine ligase